MVIDVLLTCFLSLLDAYSMEDIIYKWKHDVVKVETALMAQFDYRRASLSTSVESFAIGALL